MFPGHCLLIPKKHYETLTDLPQQLIAPLFGNAQQLAGAVEQAMGADGTFVAINNRVSQSVPHLHVHIVPRRKKDGLRGFFWPRQKYAQRCGHGTRAAVDRGGDRLKSEYGIRQLGSAGVKVSRICLGAMTYGSKQWREWVLEEEESRPFIRRALELGINFFDTADMYSVGASEEILGRALKDFGPPRDRVVIATKVFNPMGDDPNQRGLSRKHIMHAIDDSLRRLGTEYVDLYQIHRFDHDTPIEETLEALDDVVKAGKALYIGASSMYAWQFAKMLYTADGMGLARFVTHAEPLQPGVSRGGARDDAAVPRGGHRA